MISDANHVPLSPLSFLARARRTFPGKTAVIDTDGSGVSYADLAADCDAIAGALRASDVRPGDRVAVLDFNTRWLLAAHFGVPGAGAVLVALSSRLAAAEYRQILEYSRSRVLLVSPGLAGRLGAASADELPVERVVMLPGDGTTLGGSEPYGQWLNAVSVALEFELTRMILIMSNRMQVGTAREYGMLGRPAER